MAKKPIILGALLFLLAGCDCQWQDVPGAQETEERIFLQCLEKTKSSVTTAHDDEDTDDTVYACRYAAESMITTRRCVPKDEIKK